MDDCRLPLKKKRLPPLGFLDRWSLGKNQLVFNTSPEGIVPSAEYLYAAGSANGNEYSIGAQTKPWAEIADYLTSQEADVSRGLLLQASDSGLVFLNEYGSIEALPIGRTPARLSGVFLIPTGRDAANIVGARFKAHDAFLSDDRSPLPSLVGENIRYASLTFYPGVENMQTQGSLAFGSRMREFSDIHPSRAIAAIFESTSDFGEHALVLGQSPSALQIYDLDTKTLRDIELGNRAPKTAIYREGSSLLLKGKK
jgi:hypothetical protein